MRTRIRRLYLRGFQQFRDTVLDFTHPETGEALDRVCLIGRNGTGKSTVLRLLSAALNQLPSPEAMHAGRLAAWTLTDGDRSWLQVTAKGSQFDWMEVTGDLALEEALVSWPTEKGYGGRPTKAGWIDASSRSALALANGDVVVHQHADVANNDAVGIKDVPKTRLSDALGLMKSAFPVSHEVSDATVRDMWRVLIYLVKKREGDQQTFELRPENLQKTKQELIDLFDAAHPKPLEQLGELWNRILGPAGLEFDVAGASLPVQLDDNLHAYVKHKASGQRIGYAQLSTGMRNFLFRVGHLFLLYFGREVQRGFVLIDEPENSLFPDFLFDLTDTWDDILGPRGNTNTQLFVATHNPIVAAQFEPYERLVLEWDDEGWVNAHRGVAPRGDDPNDVLFQDFGLTDVMGHEGRTQWERFQALRKQLRRAPEDQKAALMAEAAEIAQKYHFGPDRP